MPFHSAIPPTDALAQTPLPPPVALADSTPRDIPTLRLAVGNLAHRADTDVREPIFTPPPSSELRFSCSVWGNDSELEAASHRRAPRVGDTILGFKLAGELGRGAFARVFLAEQQSLSNRQVALKVTLRPTREAERLARLQHTNIVPVYSVHDEGSTQLICMPFLGRATIADLIRAYRSEMSSRHQSGRRSTSARAARSTAVESKSNSHNRSDTKTGTQRVPTWTWTSDEPPPIIGEPGAVLQVLAQLACGLTHAHERGILHLDLKPANVLLADTGEPMLLDFNLSFDVSNPERELVGGTMPYMAIEQLLDMRARGKGKVDERTDLYSLGVMAYEMLTGSVPFPTPEKGIRDIESMIAARKNGPPPLRPLNPIATPAVEAIIRKLMAPEPEARYQSAEELRIDIERHLANLPLKYARETSLRERFGKWRRRNPRMPLRLTAAALVAVVIAMGGAVHLHAKGQARAEEEAARVAAVQHAAQTRAALDSVRLDLILPDDPKFRKRGIERATVLLAHYGLPEDAGWQQRPNMQRLSEVDREKLAGDLGELMILLADAKMREAAANPEAERRDTIQEAWKLSTAARTCFPESEAPTQLDRLAGVIAPAAGEAYVAAEVLPEPTGPRAMFLESAHLLNQGRYLSAIPLLEGVITKTPNHAAAQFCLAYCRHRVGQYKRAAERYDVAQVHLPGDPRPSFQRGLIHLITFQPSDADQEFSRVLAAEPTHEGAYRQRALARYRMAVQLKHAKGSEEKVTALLRDAEADLTMALKHEAAALFVHSLRGRIRDMLGDVDGAAIDAAAAIKLPMRTELDYLVRGNSRMESDPQGALEDFQQAEKLNPRSLIALQNQAHVLAEKLKQQEAALEVATRVAEMYPEFAPALAGRAVVLARLGQREESHKVIEQARLLSDDPTITFQAACVYALTSREHAADQIQAIELLRKAFQDGYRETRGLARDRDLDPIRDHPDFRKIHQSAVNLFR